MRHGNGGRKKERRSQKQIRKDEYAKRIGQTKPKPAVNEQRFMLSCHCNGMGTCTYCVQQREKASHGKTRTQGGEILYYQDNFGRRYTTWAPGRFEVYNWQR